MTISLDHQNDKISTETTILQQNDVGGLIVATGNDNVDRPIAAAGLNGLVRYDTTNNKFEVIINGAYADIVLSSTDLGSLTVTPTGFLTGSTLADLIGGLKLPAVVDKTDSHVLILTDAGKYIRMGKGTAQTITVPAESSVDFPVGTEIAIEQSGAGALTIVEDSGVTVHKISTLGFSGQYATAAIKKVASDEWVASGSLT